MNYLFVWSKKTAIEKFDSDQEAEDFCKKYIKKIDSVWNLETMKVVYWGW